MSPPLAFLLVLEGEKELLSFVCLTPHLSNTGTAVFIVKPCIGKRIKPPPCVVLIQIMLEI